MRIYKYPLASTGHQTVNMPYGARILHAATIENQVYLWAEVDERQPTQRPHRIAIYVTGEAFPKEGRYISTVVVGGGRTNLVLHIYELNPDEFDWELPK